MIPCSWDVVVPSEVCSGWDDYPQATKDSALWLASTYLWAATGRRYGPCPITVRPARSRGGEGPAYRDYSVVPGSEGLGLPGGPFLFGGRWFNAACNTACCGSAGCALVLRGPVASVIEVVIGEDVVPPSAYRVDVGGGVWLLVRTDGECWPVCQNFTADAGEEGAFTVEYEIGRPLPEALAIATAMLACEYAGFLSTGACKLPARMTRLSRQGVDIEVEVPDAATGTTGIRQVDAVIEALNPGRRRAAPMIMSPDMPGGCDRITVWSGGS
jgi:hypothetical protein